MMKRGFTLVEILVVLFIVCVLAAMLFPVTNRARESARRSACQSNLKQVGLGFMQYARDYDEKFPLAYSDNNGSGAYEANFDRGWTQILQPYLKSTAIFQCPSESQSYTPPLRATDYWYSAPAMQTREMSKFRASARTVLCGDGVAMPAAFVVTHSAIASKTNAPSLKYNGDIWDITSKTAGKGGHRHLDGMNFLFCDGHVKWLKPGTVGSANISAGEPTFRAN